jgi:hypothetical protein
LFSPGQPCSKRGEVYKRLEACDVIEHRAERGSETMSIKRKDIDRRSVDFSEVRYGRRLPRLHPGEIMRDDFLIPMGISVYELASFCRETPKFCWIVPFPQ